MLLNFCTPQPEFEDVVPPPEPVVEKDYKNPFSVENIHQAYFNLMAGSRIKSDPPPGTHNYVRFAPQNTDQIKLIFQLGYNLWDEPLHTEIEYSGHYYHHPGLPDSLNYFYTLIPVNYGIEQSVPHTILDQVILFNEDSGDEQDPEDPWEPEPECPDPYNPNCPCHEGPCARFRGDYTPAIPENLILKSTKYLQDAGVNLIELYNEAMRLAGYDDEMIETDASGRTKSIRYYPAGCIRVRDNSINQNIPVQNVQVKAKRFFKMKTGYTNANGCFSINKGFRNKAKVVVKFRNDWVAVRATVADVWQYIDVLKANIGTFQKNDLQNINFTFPYSANVTFTNHAAFHYAAAHSMTTLVQLWQYSATNNIAGYAPGSEYRINVLLLPGVRSSAPMLRAITTSLVPQVIDQHLQLNATARRVVINHIPDVLVGIRDGNTNSTHNSVNLNRTLFHEFAHVMHYNRVGNTYWNTLIGTIVANNGYGTKTGSNSGHVAVAESWGFFIGSAFNRIKYQANAILLDAEIRRLEFQRRSDGTPFGFNTVLNLWEGWIPWGMHHDLMDVGEPAATGINDLVSNYHIEGIFRGFITTSTSVQALRQAILNQNNNSQATQVNNLVESYGW